MSTPRVAADRRRRPRPAATLPPAERERVLAGHEAMVWSIARKVWRKNRRCDPDELAAEVRAAFVKCLDRFDPTKGWTFATYAYRPGVRAALAYAAAECARGFHVPAHRGFAPQSVRSFGVARPWDVPGMPEPACRRSAAVPDSGDVWGWVAAALPGRRARVVLMYYRDGLTMKEIGRREGGVSRYAVQRMIRACVLRLRAAADRGDLNWMGDQS